MRLLQTTHAHALVYNYLFKQTTNTGSTYAMVNPQTRYDPRPPEQGYHVWHVNDLIRHELDSALVILWTSPNLEEHIDRYILTQYTTEQITQLIQQIMMDRVKERQGKL